jgi:hypothetical protein
MIGLVLCAEQKRTSLKRNLSLEEDPISESREGGAHERGGKNLFEPDVTPLQDGEGVSFAKGGAVYGL